MEVWHKKNPDFSRTPPGEIHLKDYELVAEIGSEDPNDGFRLTQNAERAWRSRREILIHGNSGRSTAPGDLLKTSDGKWLYVCGMGFEEVHPPTLTAAETGS